MRWLAVTLLLLLGALTNIVVAWGFTLRADLGTTRPSQVAANQPWPGKVPAKWPYEYTHADITRVPAFRYLSYRARPAMEPDGEIAEGWLGVRMDVYRAGWPLTSLESRALSEHHWMRGYDGVVRGRSISSTHSEVRISWLHRGIDWGHEWKRLPYMPLWPGFVVNLLFYSSVIAFAAAFPIIVRRRLRARCGACLVCGYSKQGLLEGVACPECGNMRRQ